MTRTRKGQNSSSVVNKSHPLEGDGCLINLFQHLWKKNSNTLESCPGVRIPDTVVYEHNFPREWIYFDQKSKELKKRSGKELDQKTIKRDFTAPVKMNASSASSKASNNNQMTDVDVLASYISSQHTKSGVERVSVDFLSKQDLEHFLMNGSRKEAGILQRFVVPKGQKNSVVQAVWSPHVTLVERRTNTKKLFDAKTPIYDRAVTYEGPTHYSSEVFVAPQLVKHIKKICQNIVKHFEQTEHKKISRMVLYFKVDADDNIWLLWSSSLRIKEPKIKTSAATSALLNRPTAPLNLSPSFASPDTVNKAPPRPRGALAASGSSGAKKKSSFGATPSAGSKKKKKTKKPDIQSTPFKCPNCGKKRTGPRHALPLHVVLNAYKDEMKSSSPRKTKLRSPTKAGASTLGSPTRSSAPNDANLTSTQKQIMEELDDLLYEAYSHFLHSYEPFRFTLPSELTSEQHQELKESLLQLGVQENEEQTQFYIQHHTVSIGKLHKEFETFKRLLSSNTRNPDDTPAQQRQNLDDSMMTVTTENLAEDMANKRSSERNDAVPPVLLKFLPDLTNQSYRELRKEPLFMSRPVPVCESCMLKVTHPVQNNKKSFKRLSSGNRLSRDFDRSMTLGESQLSARSNTVKSGRRKSSRRSTNDYQKADSQLFEDLDTYMEKL